MFAIIDIETTGLSAKSEKITEIAILLHNGRKITEQFHSLVNPEKNIPYQITQLTGINNQMVKDAPKFYELAKKIVELTQDRIIVAHNARFDYGFLQQEFSEFGYNFQRKTLCTVKTSRKLIPGQASYSLGKLTASLGLSHHNKHRALGDALATAELWQMLYNIDPSLGGEDNIALPAALDHEIIKNLPRKTGVYYFLNSKEEVIYVGKSLDIHQRILQHLNNYSTRKSIEMINNIAQIRFTVTGSELAALLLESDEIKKINPLYNRAKRRSIFQYGLFSTVDENGYFRLKISKIEALSLPLTSFQSQDSGKEFMHRMVREYELCQKLSGLYESAGACFDYQIHQCNGACIGKESKEVYNKKVELFLASLQFRHQNFFILERGPEPGLRYAIHVANGVYQGMGIIEEALEGSQKHLHQAVKAYQNNRDTHQIIQSYLRHNQPQLLIYG